MSDAHALRPGRLVLVPAIITLAVTLLRLAGERMHWSHRLFNPEAGGGGALVGIVWLVFVFGVYFALKLSQAGEGPGRLGRSFGIVALAVVVFLGPGLVAQALGVPPTSFTMFFIFVAASVAAFFLALRAWPALGRVLTVYGLAARIPVALVMLVAIFGNWGTHYDVPPSEDFPVMSPLLKWLVIGLVPQMTAWIAFTVVGGMLVGLLAVALVHRGRRPATA
jgi:hypothetical protein